MGRRTKLTPEVQKRICDAIRGGNFFEVACEWAGVDASTGYNWIQRGEGTHPSRRKTKQYVEFVDAIRAAEREAEVSLVVKWRQVDDWRAIAEFLSRRFPERWMPRQRQEVSGPDGGKLQHEVVVYEVIKHLSGGHSEQPKPEPEPEEDSDRPPSGPGASVG